MARGLVRGTVLTDIANAIRFQNGRDEDYLPMDMAGAVARLDGTREGEGAQRPYKGLGKGMIRDADLRDIADAIRTQNGLETTYRPDEMAQAIRDLVFVKEPRARGLLLDDGTLEITYLADATSPSGSQVQKVYDVGDASFNIGSPPAWYKDTQLIDRVRIDQSMVDCEREDYSFWFYMLDRIREVRGLENLAHARTADYLFGGCKELDSIYAPAGYVTPIERAGSLFSSSYRIVGGTGCNAGESAKLDALKLGEDGVLTDPEDDRRAWLYEWLYDDGELVVTTVSDPDGGRTLLAGGRICVNCRYASEFAYHHHYLASSVRVVRIADDVRGCSAEKCLNRWFYKFDALGEVQGLANLGNVVNIRYLFGYCGAIDQVDLRGFDPSKLVEVSYCFYNCKALTTILADAGWQLPDGVEGASVFTGDTLLEGGAGFGYSSMKTNYKYFCIDSAETPGYLTAG